jgi:hypothetical protein
MKRLEREGYGSAFNELYIGNGCILKKAKTDYGRKKLEMEKRFYEYIVTNQVDFPVPSGYKDEVDGYSMVYYDDWIPFFQLLHHSPDKLDSILPPVYKALEQLHHSSFIPVSKETVKQDLLYEMVQKLKDRKQEIESILEPYSFLQTVNGMQLESFETLLLFFLESIDKFVEKTPVFSYRPIHGDCQFNNILLSPDAKKFLFLDPRASFGQSVLYGLEEYDYAKIYFALSGYDTFDASRIEHLIIEGSDISLPDLSLQHQDMNFDPFISILTASIWMGNAHCFKSTPLKAVTSYFYGLQYATRVYRAVKSRMR